MRAIVRPSPPFRNGSSGGGFFIPQVSPQFANDHYRYINCSKLKIFHKIYIRIVITERVCCSAPDSRFSQHPSKTSGPGSRSSEVVGRRRSIWGHHVLARRARDTASRQETRDTVRLGSFPYSWWVREGLVEGVWKRDASVGHTRCRHAGGTKRRAGATRTRIGTRGDAGRAPEALRWTTHLDAGCSPSTGVSTLDVAAPSAGSSWTLSVPRARYGLRNLTASDITSVLITTAMSTAKTSRRTIARTMTNGVHIPSFHRTSENYFARKDRFVLSEIEDPRKSGKTDEVEEEKKEDGNFISDNEWTLSLLFYVVVTMLLQSTRHNFSPDLSKDFSIFLPSLLMHFFYRWKSVTTVIHLNSFMTFSFSFFSSKRN